MPMKQFCGRAMPYIKADEDKAKPAAILVVFPKSRTEITAAQRDSVWKELKAVKGVNLDESRKLIQNSALGIVLDNDGGAKLQEIAVAFQAAGLPLQAR
jgi:hypothetical protein